MKYPYNTRTCHFSLFIVLIRNVSLFTLVVIKEANFVMNINETNHNIGNYRLSSILLEIDIILYLSQL
jgi:hypothetical protein